MKRWKKIGLLLFWGYWIIQGFRLGFDLGFLLVGIIVTILFLKGRKD